MSIFERSKIFQEYFTSKCNNVLLVIVNIGLRCFIYIFELNDLM